ncbi:DedA family protein [Rhizobium aegyptiacum]|uniref:DedA family protein n=1 Tax=Rhizobium aegyptiacum TaxID=1764550 RepID=UPI0007E58C04|nr:DedA family protein [Rhizobium aegyptiacum]
MFPSDPLAVLIPIVTACGIATPMIATFLERLIPVLPSYVLLVLIGVAAAHGTFSLPTAVVFSLIGSVVGCLCFYAVGRSLGERRWRRCAEELARIFRVSPEKYRSWEDRFRANERSIALIAQLVPTMRLVAPGISGVLRAGFWQFVAATTVGASLWNGLFIGVGYVFARIDVDTNTSVLALKTMVALIVAETIVFLSWRWKVLVR